jgi:hypothetical protein
MVPALCNGSWRVMNRPIANVGAGLHPYACRRAPNLGLNRRINLARNGHLSFAFQRYRRLLGIGRVKPNGPLGSIHTAIRPICYRPISDTRNLHISNGCSWPIADGLLMAAFERLQPFHRASRLHRAGRRVGSTARFKRKGILAYTVEKSVSRYSEVVFFGQAPVAVPNRAARAGGSFPPTLAGRLPLVEAGSRHFQPSDISTYASGDVLSV